MLRSKALAAIVVVVLLLVMAGGSAFAQTSFFTGRSADYGFAVGAWFGGPVSLEDRDIHKEAGLLVHAYSDFYLMEKLSMGLYANFSPVSYEEFDRGATMYEMGFSIKPRFFVSGGAVAIKPGLEIGYRGESFNAEGSESIQAMGLNVSVEVQFTTGGQIMPYGVVGFLSQPVGGNSQWDVAHAPMFYVGVGIAI